MGIVLLTIGLLIVGVVLLILGWKIMDIDIIAIIGIILCFFSGVALLVEIIGVSVVQGTAENKYNQKLYQKEVLEYRLESGELQGNELLYHDITEFNNELRSVKYWYNNPWTNWFNNGKVASIDYIELKYE